MAALSSKRGSTQQLLTLGTQTCQSNESHDQFCHMSFSASIEINSGFVFFLSLFKLLIDLLMVNYLHLPGIKGTW